MKELLFIIILFEFFSFSIETIYIKKKRNKIACNNLNLTLYKISIKEFDNKNQNYGFNPQNCKLREKDDGFRCCYVSLKYDEEWYNFCAEVITNVGDDFIDYNLDNITILDSDNLTDIKKRIKIDCFSKKLNIFNRLYLIVLMLLIFSYF